MRGQIQGRRITCPVCESPLHGNREPEVPPLFAAIGIALCAVKGSQIILPSPASPVLPLHLRPASLAGVAIVERAGPAMLEMLNPHTLGENRARFGRLAAATIGSDRLLKP